MNRELVNAKAVALLREPAVLNGTEGTDYVDLQGFDAATLAVMHGDVTAAGGANNLTISVSHAPDGSNPALLASYAAVPAADLRGTFDLLEDGVLAGVQAVGYVGGRRYVRVVATLEGAASAITGVAAVLELSSRQSAVGIAPATGTPA